MRCWLSSDDLTQQDRAEARFPELLGRGSSSGDTATRTAVLEDTTDPKQKPRVRSGRPKRLVTEAGVRVKRLGDTTLVLRPGKIKPLHPLRLKSVARSGLPEECSACDERTKANRPAAAKFAQQRLGQRKQRFKPVKSHLTAFIRRFHDLRKKNETRPFPKVKPEEVDAQEDEEEEEEADPGSDVDFSGDDPSSGGDLQVSLSNSSCCVSWLKQERQFRPWLGRLKLSKRNSTK